LRDQRRYEISPAYEENFRRAELTFLHQLVWDPLSRRIVHLQPIVDDLLDQDLSFLGKPLDPDTGFKIANGLINPATHVPWTSESLSNLNRSTPTVITPVPQTNLNLNPPVGSITNQVVPQTSMQKCFPLVRHVKHSVFESKINYSL
jgi:hypothetical protein